MCAVLGYVDAQAEEGERMSDCPKCHGGPDYVGCTAPCPLKLDECPHDEGIRIQCFDNDGCGYYLWQCVACGWETLDNLP